MSTSECVVRISVRSKTLSLSCDKKKRGIGPWHTFSQLISVVNVSHAHRYLLPTCCKQSHYYPNDLFLCTNRQVSATIQLLRLLLSAGSHPTCSSTYIAALPHTVLAFGDSFLHHFPNAVINRIKVRAVRWPYVGSNECLTTKQPHCLTCTISRCVILLKDESFIGDALGGWQQQQFVSIRHYRFVY